VEDFFSFLSRSGRQSVLEEEEEAESFEAVQEQELQVAEDQGILGLSEGTGEPRPLPREPAPEPPVNRREKLRPGPPVEVPLPPRPVPSPEATFDFKPKKAAPDVTQANWDRMPHHLQTLVGTVGDEVAQNSYKTFKETREQLIQRLLDPIISLEEAARVLNVCPTTVRRYTNRGVLKHYRTAGNQRRFKLSDVLAFMESGKRSEPKDQPAE
jgi:excisionase family DNA binding protein